MNPEKQIELLNQQINNDIAASYYVGRYYFSVNTNKDRSDFGLQPEQDISIDTQREMQSMNIIPMFHEYIHYIHEISTVTGNLGLHLDVSLKSVFSHYFNASLLSCEHHGIDRTDTKMFGYFKAFYNSKESINGHVMQDAKILRIFSIDHKFANISFLNGTDIRNFNFNLPEIEVELFENHSYKRRKILFGKFFIYEGLAYELDRILEQQVLRLRKIKDDKRGTEYTFLRFLARFIYPNVDVESYLTAASLSLNFHNCGETFIGYINRIKSETEAGAEKNKILAGLKAEVSHHLFSRMTEYNEAQDELPTVFIKRQQLHKAFSEIATQAKKGYLLRCEKPSFEVDLIVAGDYAKLLDIVPICDYIYVFKDAEEYKRDFLGTASFTDEISQALKVLIVLDHYQKSHQLSATIDVESTEKIKCPFYCVCDLRFRNTHAAMCAEKPWRTFEISASTDKKYCWYGQGVGEAKGHNEL